MTDSVQKSRSYEWLAMFSIVLVTVLYALNFTQSVVVLDTARDLYYATEIRQFGDWPLLGPDIGGFFHTGPIWFYFLALPALTGSLTFLAFLVGLFAGMKFVIAYRLGSEIINKKFGLLWAFMLLLPGWHVINQMIIGHINLLETLALFLLLMLYRFLLTGASKYWFLAALTVGLGFQAHPSFLVLLVFYIPLIWQRRRQLSIPMFLLAACLFLLPLLPYIFDQLMNGMLDLDRWSSRNQNLDQIRATGKVVSEQSWWLHWFDNVGSLLMIGPQRINDFVNFHVPNLGPYMRYFYLAVMLLTTTGTLLLFIDKKLRKGYVLAASGLLLALLLVTLMRSFTPFYMLLSLTPVLAGLFALGAYQLLRHSKTARVSLMVVLFCLGFIPYFAVHKAAKHHQIYFGPVMNITQKLPANWLQSQFTLDVLSVAESRALSAVFCDKSTVLNGPLTPVLDLTGGVTLKFYCDDFELQLTGANSNQQQALFVMHKSFWDLLEKQPDYWLTPSWGLTTDYQNQVNHSGLELLPFDPYVHPPRSNTAFGKSTQVLHKKVLAINAPYLVFTNVLPTNMTFSVTDITANGLPVELVVENAANRLYHCPSCRNETVSWQFDIKTNYAPGIDINTLPE